MNDRDYMTTRGALLAQMEYSRKPWGYVVESYKVWRLVGGWAIYDIDGPISGPAAPKRFATFTEALEWIAEEINLP